MRSPAKKRRKESRHRPILAARVNKEFLAHVRDSARKNGRNVSEELIWQAQQGYLLEDAETSVLDYMKRRFEDVAALAKHGIESELGRLGYTRLPGIAGRSAWLEPGMDVFELSDDMRATFREIMRVTATAAAEAAVERAFQKIKETKS